MRIALFLLLLYGQGVAITADRCRRASSIVLGNLVETTILNRTKLSFDVKPEDIGNFEALGEWQRKFDQYLADNRNKPEFRALLLQFIVEYCNFPRSGAVPGDAKGLVRPIQHWTEFFHQEPFRFVRRRDGKWEAAEIDLNTYRFGEFKEVDPTELRPGGLVDNALNHLRNVYQLHTDIRKLKNSGEVEAARRNYFEQGLIREAYNLWKAEATPAGSPAGAQR